MPLAAMAERLDLVGDEKVPAFETENTATARILIVDDDANAALLMSRLLERDGFTNVVTCGDGRTAIAMMFEHPPEVMILDVHMPHIDGHQVLREMQHSERRVSTVTGVLAVSGDASPATCRAMLCAGADDFIVRPFDSQEFALRVRRLASTTRELRKTLNYVSFLERRLRDLGD